jgi:AraC-like DNA-binding protein
MNSCYNLVLENNDVWLSSFSKQLDVNSSKNHLVFPKDLGNGFLHEFQIEEGLLVTFGELEFTTELRVNVNASRSKKSITIFFKYLEKGHTFFKPIGGEYKEVKSGGVQFFSSNVNNQLIFPSNTHCFIFKVQMTIDWLRNNLNEFIGQNDEFTSLIFGRNKIMHFEPLTNRFMRLFSDVFKSEFDPKLNQILVKDKGYEAVVLFFDHFYKQFFKYNIDPKKYSIDDQKKLYELVDFIKENLQKKISLDQLCREVGFSKSKLQALFHYFFHQSIYAYIKNLKFEGAVSMLLSSDKDIRFIAHQLGYNSSTHFINIFKKHYGISPKKYRMKKHALVGNGEEEFN